MKNDFEIRGNTVAIFLKNGKEALIDLEDLEKVSSIKGTWTTYNNPKYETWYVYTRIQTNNKAIALYLHRLVLGEPGGMDVDHINGNRLDNRKENLRVVSHKENIQNRPHGENKNSKSGVRGVCWYSKYGKWMAQIKVNYKTINGGYFDTIEEAEQAVKELRRKHMPCSSEGSESSAIL